MLFYSVSFSDQQQVEPLFCSGCDRDPVAVQQADFVVHEAPVAPQQRLQGLGEVDHRLQVWLTPLGLLVDGLKREKERNNYITADLKLKGH